MQKDKQDNGDDENGGEVKVEVTVPARSKEYDEGPPPSRTKDDYSHHSSPQPSDVQQVPEHARMPKIGQRTVADREITGGAPKRVEVPMHVTKHPEPRGRPRQTESDDYD